MKERGMRKRDRETDRRTDRQSDRVSQRKRDRGSEEKNIITITIVIRCREKVPVTGKCPLLLPHKCINMKRNY